jgi:hypothetical protein
MTRPTRKTKRTATRETKRGTKRRKPTGRRGAKRRSTQSIPTLSAWRLRLRARLADMRDFMADPDTPAAQRQLTEQLVAAIEHEPDDGMVALRLMELVSAWEDEPEETPASSPSRVVFVRDDDPPAPQTALPPVRIVWEDESAQRSASPVEP